jgi:hypothetical protein
MIFWGIAALAVGFGKWIASSGEMRALGIPASPPRMALPAQHVPALAEIQQSPTQPQLNTDPITAPSSITEHTTHHLEDGVYPSRMADKSRQME